MALMVPEERLKKMEQERDALEQLLRDLWPFYQHRIKNGVGPKEMAVIDRLKMKLGGRV